MNSLARGRRAVTMCAAIAVLAGCAGGSGNPIGSTGLPSAQSVVPGMQGTQTAISSYESMAISLKPAGKALRKTVITVKLRGAPQFGKEARIAFHNDLHEIVLKKGKTDSKGEITFWFPPNRSVCAAAFLNNDRKKALCLEPFPKEHTFNFN
jgi:hypothetical protein